MKMRYLITLIIITMLSVMTLNAQNMRNVNGIQNLSDNELIMFMSSEDIKEAELASKEIFARGEKMIPLLIELEGNTRCFYGIEALGNWDIPGLSVVIPSCNSKSVYQVTIETAALYLISAIFHDDLTFASPPVLCDFESEKKSCADAGNTQERILKAWQSTKNWYSLLKAKGLKYLRERNQEPLNNSGLAFH